METEENGAKFFSARGVQWRNESLWMCDVCEEAPASVTCNADADALCVTCDRDIHSANPLARKHERVPVYNTTGNNTTVDPDMKSIQALLSNPGHFMEFEYPSLHHQNCGSDSVVPVQPGRRFEIDFTSYTTPQTISQTVSSSSMDVGVVPDGSSMSDTSHPFALQLNSGVDLSGSTNTNQATHLSSMDREARVMRYREKRKNRKFEKTIRYASRKAYAETRPRIKGRFAKRAEAHNEVDPWYTTQSTPTMGGDSSGYGVVPTFLCGR